MGHDERTDRQAAADAFFEQFIDAPLSVVMRVQRERGGNLEKVVAEDKEFGYWARKMADRAARRTEREIAEWTARTAQFDRLDALRTQAPPAVPVDEAEQPAVILPEPRIVLLTDQERDETRRWWQRLADHRGTRTLGTRIRREIRQAEQDDKFAARATATWQLEQRAFERAEWRAVIARRDGRAEKKVALQWAAITEDRALAIALAAYDKTHPPQGEK